MGWRNCRRRPRPARFQCSTRLCECNERPSQSHDQRRNPLHLRAAVKVATGFRWMIVGALSLASVAAAGARPAELRVCADPNNLPFSNSKGEGFENRIAELVAREMGSRVKYTWWAQRRRFIRNTINAFECDVVIGVP